MKLQDLVNAQQLQEAAVSSAPWQIRLRVKGEDVIAADNVAPKDLDVTLKMLAKKHKVDRSEFEMFRHNTKSYREANK